MEYVDEGITVNHIPPGMIDTPMSGRTREQTAALAATMPMRRPGSAGGDRRGLCLSHVGGRQLRYWTDSQRQWRTLFVLTKHQVEQTV